MTWGFIWLMFVLKIPIIGLFSIVWWAVRQPSEPAPPETARTEPRPHPHRPDRPKRRRPRGPHGDPAALPAPPRVRPVTAIAPAIAAREHRSGRAD
jgi:hypothetical protein